jgi:hypothetical protein
VIGLTGLGIVWNVQTSLPVRRSQARISPEGPRLGASCE